MSAWDQSSGVRVGACACQVTTELQEDSRHNERSFLHSASSHIPKCGKHLTAAQIFIVVSLNPSGIVFYQALFTASSALRWHMPVNPSQFICVCVSVGKHIESPRVPVCDGCIAAVVQGLTKESAGECRFGTPLYSQVERWQVGLCVCVCACALCWGGNDGITRAFEGK